MQKVWGRTLAADGGYFSESRVPLRGRGYSPGEGRGTGYRLGGGAVLEPASPHFMTAQLFPLLALDQGHASRQDDCSGQRNPRTVKK